jgi:hypothetical protein
MAMRIDLHVHTKHSIDAIIEPRYLVRKSRGSGIIPAITDHNNLAAHKEMKKLRAKFIPGEEIRTAEGDLIALYIEETIPKKTPFLEAIDMIREQGGLSYLPHPFDKTRKGVHDPKLAAKVDIVEIFNARCPVRLYNREAENLARIKKKLYGAGSDSHFLFEFGRTFVEVKDFDLDSPKALLKVLKNAHIHGHKAPIFVRGSTLVVKHAKRFLEGLKNLTR